MITNPDEILHELSGRQGSAVKRSFSADHMLAGNVIRLRKSVEIDPDLGFKYSNLTKGQVRFGAFIDRLFWFWARP